METSATPEKALPSAYLLDTLVRGAGHLLHMPSHIYINTGDYHLGTLSNIRAVEVDSSYATACHAQGAYPLAYNPHNWHFLAATATLEGNSAWAWRSAVHLQNIPRKKSCACRDGDLTALLHHPLLYRGEVVDVGYHCQNARTGS